MAEKKIEQDTAESAPLDEAVVENPELPLEPVVNAPEPKRGEVTLYLAGPFWVTSYTAVTEEGDTIVFDKQGVNVRKTHADTLISDAHNYHGVTIAEVSTE